MAPLLSRLFPCLRAQHCWRFPDAHLETSAWAVRSAANAGISLSLSEDWPYVGVTGVVTDADFCSGSESTKLKVSTRSLVLTELRTCERTSLFDAKGPNPTHGPQQFTRRPQASIGNGSFCSVRRLRRCAGHQDRTSGPVDQQLKSSM